MDSAPGGVQVGTFGHWLNPGPEPRPGPPRSGALFLTLAGLVLLGDQAQEFEA